MHVQKMRNHTNPSQGPFASPGHSYDMLTNEQLGNILALVNYADVGSHVWGNMLWPRQQRPKAEAIYTQQRVRTPNH
jgi:hypothetical protein